MENNISPAIPIAALIGGLLTFAAPWNANASGFYAGKTIRVVVGFAAGGGHDTYARAVTRHMGKHIPGNPSFAVENMDGAGSLLAANYLYRKAGADGLTIGSWNNLMILQQALGAQAVRFDARRFGWIGAPSQSRSICVVMGFTGLKNLDDVLSSKRALKIGATRAGSTTDDLPKLMNMFLKTNFNVISGYTGTATIRVAMQSHALDGACWGWESMKVTARPLLSAGGDERLIPYVIDGATKDPEVKDLPQFTDAIKDPDDLAAFKVWKKPKEFERPLAVPPNTPKERLEVFRQAYQQTLADPAFLAEAEKAKLLIEPVRGERVEQAVNELLAISPDTKRKLRFLIGKQEKIS
ncbi:MAG: Bug family tripartite tricarboxylate transporter substrate binding protein [Candidatus Binatia bacterium]